MWILAQSIGLSKAVTKDGWGQNQSGKDIDVC